MTTAAVIVAAGRGVRAGPGPPKQWRLLKGRTLTAHALAAFRAAPEVARIVLVLHSDDMDLAAGYADLTVVQGGADRASSVRAGLEALARSGVTRVLIHDVARPLISAALISRVVEALSRTPGAAPALELTDALWRAADGQVTSVEPRHGLYRAQTPQGFRYEAILAAHRAHSGGAADDVEVARAAGLEVAVVPGDENNLKITRPVDFDRAEQLLGAEMDIRVGNGFDVHAFTDGDHVVLCGIRVPHGRGLAGHSDADVAMHAVTDAIYGALADGDIGRHFPPSDPDWADAASFLFLEHAVSRAWHRGFEIGHADCTLICEAPGIAPYADDMQANLAAIMEVATDRVSVKATTTEHLGFTGRGEGIAAMATVTLRAK